MNYSQKVRDKAEEIQHLSDAFEEVRSTLSILQSLDLRGINDHLSSSIYKVVELALLEIDAIECKIESDYTKKE